MREAGANFYETSPFCEATPLQVCRAGDLKQLQNLLVLHPKIVREKFQSAISGEFTKLLFIAALNGHTECVKALLDAEAEPNDEQTLGINPVFISAQEGHVACLQALIDAKANLDTTTATGATPAYIAA